MLTKKDILYDLENLKINKDNLIILSGASLVMQNIILETKDIDIAVSKEVYDKFKSSPVKGAFGKEIKSFGNFEIGYNLYDSDYVIIEGYKCASIKSILDTKKVLNRPKDKKIIEYLEKLI